MGDSSPPLLHTKPPSRHHDSNTAANRRKPHEGPVSGSYGSHVDDRDGEGFRTPAIVGRGSGTGPACKDAKQSVMPSRSVRPLLPWDRPLASWTRRSEKGRMRRFSQSHGQFRWAPSARALPLEPAHHRSNCPRLKSHSTALALTPSRPQYALAGASGKAPGGAEGEDRGLPADPLLSL